MDDEIRVGLLGRLEVWRRESGSREAFVVEVCGRPAEGPCGSARVDQAAE
jgi:hypothetical protein